MPEQHAPRLPRLETGVAGFDQISLGGLPAGRACLVVGTSGSGKTVFALQLLAEGIRRYGEAGVFVTFDEPADKLRQAVVEFGWDLPSWEHEGLWEFVDARAGIEEAPLVVGEHFDLTVLLTRIEAAVRRTGAKRVALDSLHALFARFGDREAVRDGLVRVTAGLERMGVTALMTTGRASEYEELTGLGVEEYVADNVVVLRNALTDESRRRTVEVLKLRGTGHRQGEFPFAITPEHGLVVIPLSVQLDQASGSGRITTGSAELDAMCHGGLFQNSVTLLSGSTGTGKTTLALLFALAGAARGEPAVVVGFEESRDQMVRGVEAWGYDVAALEQQGLLRFVVDYPEVRTFEQHLVRVQGAVDELHASRVVVDSLTSLRRSGPDRSFREFAIGLTAYLKQRQVAAVLTSAQTSLFGTGVEATEEHVSALADGIVLLRYVEVYGELKRALAVVKMRGSDHEKTIREYTIGPQGLAIGSPLRSTTGIMSGRASQLDVEESARVTEAFGVGP